MEEVLLNGGSIALIIGGIILASGFSRWRLVNLISKVSPNKIASIGEGLYEVEGQATTTLSQRTPFSKVPCSYYRVSVQRLRSSAQRNKGLGQWKTINRSSTASQTFCLEDSSGSIEVLPSRARIFIDESWSQYFENASQCPAHIKEYMRQHWIFSRTLLFFPRSLRFVEYAICPDDSVYAFGWCRCSADGKRSISRKYPFFGPPLILGRGTESSIEDEIKSGAQLGIWVGALISALSLCAIVCGFLS